MSFRILYDKKMPGCYAAGVMGECGREKAVFASEREGTGPIIRIDPDTLEEEILSKGPGGGMNVIGLPGERDSFLAIQRFFPIFKSEEAVIMWGRKGNNGYQCKEVQKLPFVHRIDVMSCRGEDYLLAASLCENKMYTDDWDYPGSIYAGRIDYVKQEIVDFHIICGNIYKNHGFTKTQLCGKHGVLISGECGVFLLTPPRKEGGEWEKEVYIDSPASDAQIADVDGDDVPEIGVISPFHGNQFHIYKKVQQKWVKVYELPGNHKFGHAIWGGRFNGKNAFLVGFRDAGKELYLITMEGGSYTAELVEKGAGPANVTVVHTGKGDYICAANRESDRCTIYDFSG